MGSDGLFGGTDLISQQSMDLLVLDAFSSDFGAETVSETVSVSSGEDDEITRLTSMV
jgi:hypothetical protein